MKRLFLRKHKNEKLELTLSRLEFKMFKSRLTSQLKMLAPLQFAKNMQEKLASIRLELDSFRLKFKTALVHYQILLYWASASVQSVIQQYGEKMQSWQVDPPVDITRRLKRLSNQQYWLKSAQAFLVRTIYYLFQLMVNNIGHTGDQSTAETVVQDFSDECQSYEKLGEWI